MAYVITAVKSGTLAQPETQEPAIVPVFVMLKEQPAAPSESGEQANLSGQDQLIERWKADFGLDVDRRPGYLINGFSANVREDKIGFLSMQPEVASVKRERVYLPSEHYVEEAQGVARAFKKHGLDGAGTVVSVIDTGVAGNQLPNSLIDLHSAVSKALYGWESVT